jgi:hypothetical protein
MKALSPKEVKEGAMQSIPTEVVSVVNSLLKKHWQDGEPIRLKQSLITTGILELKPEATRNDVYDKGWLNFEPLFEASGWSVFYDKIGFNEQGESAFVFTPKRVRLPRNGRRAYV